MTRLPVQPGDSRPAISINLEELKFWLSIMQEHAVFIKAGLPVNRKDAIQEAQEFYRCFGALLAKADGINSDKKFKELVRQSTGKVEEFLRFKRRLLRLALRGELCGCLYPSLLDHMAREAEYFLRLLESMKDCKPFQLWSKTRELSFWLRLMSDHDDFIRQMLDPSEVILIETTEGFTTEFDGLFRQSLDFSSMLRGANENVPSFGRFLQDSRAATTRLRDFNRALYGMLEDKRVLGLMTPLFADHVRREADHFLMVAAMLENNLQTSSYAAAEAKECEIAAEEATAAAEAAAETANLTAASKLAALQQKAMQAAQAAQEPEEIDDDTAPAAAVSPASKAKYNWTSSWPRPLEEEKV
ncbi:MAG: DUF2935 domain-containing protein [Sporomusaceae bacterium]|nr:DUF2935 domain-containing protein [Sporomusaceae bacterium]